MSRDPLDELRAAWREVGPPPPVRALENEDWRTRAAVNWLAAAYRAAPVPPVRVALPTHRPIESAPWVAMAITAAAAVLLALLSLALRQTADSPGDAAPPDTPIAVAPQVEPPVLVASTTADRIEMRSGPVRLVVLTGAGAGKGPEPAGPAPTRTDERDEPR